MTLLRDLKTHSRLIPILVLISGVLLSSLSGWFLYKLEEKVIISEFQKDVDERAASLYREVTINFETLRSLAILFARGTVPERKQFSLEAQKILTRHLDIQALEWIPRVIHSKRAAFESNQLQDFPEFEITERLEQGKMVTAEKRQEYYPVYYVEPLIGNEAAVGFDLASNSTRLETLEKSRDFAIPLATASITLVQERENQKGFLAFLPIYRGSPATLIKRRDNLMGFVLGVYRIGDIFASSAHRNGALGIEMKLVDETLIYSHDILHIHKSGTEVKVYEGIIYRKELPEVWGRKWSLIASPTLSYVAVRRNMLPLVILVSGIIITIFTSLYIYIISRRTATIQRIVIEKTSELNEANKALELLSRTDGLTGVANRRFMDEFIDKEWLRAIRNKLSISFILIDIDFFKLYNDNYGHPEGDECLKKVAATLKSLVRRPGDLVARYGGEEFALVLSDTKEAELVANNCRQSIEELQIAHKFSEAANVVTISVGLCTVSPDKGTDPKSVIYTADKALYKAKDGGRNRVEQIVFHP